MEACAKKQDVQNTKVERRLLGNNFRIVQRIHEDATEGGEMKRQQRMKVMEDMTKKVRSNGRMDADKRWSVAELLAVDCEKRGSIQERKKPCKNGMFGWKMKMRRERWKNCSKG